MMTGMLGRRVLEELLRREGGYSQRIPAKKIDAFLEDSEHPSAIKKNIHYLREIGNFGGHVQEDETDGTVIRIEAPEAEWTLVVIDRLFDYFIIQPKQDEQMRDALDEKIERAGRKPIAGVTEPTEEAP